MLTPVECGWGCAQPGLRPKGIFRFSRLARFLEMRKLHQRELHPMPIHQRLARQHLKNFTRQFFGLLVSLQLFPAGWKIFAA
jgi:hypothetical protein